MDQIDEFDALYPTCWPLIYQVDVRTRMEKVLKLKRRGADEKALAIKNGQTHPYDENQPWEWVMSELVDRGEQ